MKEKWRVVGLAGIVGMLLAVGTLTIGRTAVSELAGLAVAQTATQWNNVADASKGDGLTSGVMASGTYMFNGLTFDRLRSAPSSDGSAGTGFQANVPMLFNGTTYDRPRGGLTTDDNAVTGMFNNAQMVFDGTNYDRVRSANADSLTATLGLLASGNIVFNGSTWDRLRTASADNLAATGILAGGNVGFDGSTWDRRTSISNTNNIATTSQGATYVTPISTWSVTNTVIGAVTAASASKAAGGGTVRHVATGITICYFDTVVAGVSQVNLRDGATGAGTIIRSWLMSVPTTNASQCEELSGLNMTGSANTAMTLEFGAATAATSSKTVTLTGYSTP